MFRQALGVPAPPSEPVPALPTGLRALDALLGGGLPVGQLLELSGGPSSGKSTLALSACLSLLARGRSVAWIDPTGAFWPLAALEAGLPLERLLVSRVKDGMAALKAAHLVLSCRGAAAAVVVTLPPGFVPAETNLLKLRRLAEQGSAALVFVTERAASAPSLGACVALRLCVKRRLGKHGATLRVEVARHKKGPTSAQVEEEVGGPDRLRVRSTL